MHALENCSFIDWYDSLIPFGMWISRDTVFWQPRQSSGIYYGYAVQFSSMLTAIALCLLCLDSIYVLYKPCVVLIQVARQELTTTSRLLTPSLYIFMTTWVLFTSKTAEIANFPSLMPWEVYQQSKKNSEMPKDVRLKTRLKQTRMKRCPKK